MKIVVNRESLLEAFKVIIPITNVNGSAPSLPILGNVKLETGENSVTFTGTNLDSYVTVTVPCEVEVVGSTTLPIKRLNNLIKEMVKGNVTIDSSVEDVSVIRCGSSKFKVNGMPVTDFPANNMKLAVGNKSVTMKQKDFKTLMKHSSYAVSTDLTRMVLNGVLFEFKGSEFNMVSTDGRRLAFDRLELESVFDDTIQLIVPSLIKDEVRKLSKDEGDMTIQFNKDYVCFTFDNVSVYSKLVSATYPNYQQVIPRGQSNKVKVSRDDAIRVLRRVSTMAEKDKGSVSVCFSSGKLTVSCTTANIGYAEDSLEVEYCGIETKISLNPDYLIDALSSLEGEEVYISFDDGHSPCCFTGEGKAFSLIMPLRVS
jgi:DNA polymerase-3 subunit beta